MNRRLLLFILALIMVLAVPAYAQQLQPTATTTPVNPNATITWPPPVYVLRGEIDIRGTANVPNMSNFFI